MVTSFLCFNLTSNPIFKKINQTLVVPLAPHSFPGRHPLHGHTRTINSLHSLFSFLTNSLPTPIGSFAYHSTKTRLRKCPKASMLPDLMSKLSSTYLFITSRSIWHSFSKNVFLITPSTCSWFLICQLLINLLLPPISK